jgi:hypothetical protein
LKEPLFWFFIVGGLLFAADTYYSNQPATVIVDAAVKARLGNLWKVQTGKEASPEELESIVQNWLKEEVFYREALRLGLDRHDSIVRRRLVQKLGFLVEEVPMEGDESRTIEEYYNQNIEKYSLPVRYSISQIFFSDRGSAGEIQTSLNEHADWRTLGENSLLNPSYVSRSEREIDSIFGRVFVGQLFTLVQGQWVGPLRSSYGYHLVRLERILPSEATPLAYIERKVFADYQQSRADAAMEKYYQDLLQKYEVVFE